MAKFKIFTIFLMWFFVLLNLENAENITHCLALFQSIYVPFSLTMCIHVDCLTTSCVYTLCFPKQWRTPFFLAYLLGLVFGG
jgi:hypothetical protein